MGYRNLFRASLILAIAIILSIAAFSRSRSLARRDGAACSGLPVTATVLSAKERRYDTEALVSMELTEEKPHSSTGIAFLPSSHGIKKGDILTIQKKPAPLGEPGRDITPYQSSLARKGIDWVFYLKDKDFSVRQCRPSRKDRIRNGIAQQCRKLFQPDTSAVILALYFGNKNHIGKATLTRFRKAGVLHILAASGLHIGIIAAIPFLIMGLLRINKRLIFPVTAAILAFYLYITDMPVSLLRACIMYALFAIQYIFGLERNMYNTLFIAAAIILVISPFELYNPGFQLSFGATMGILLLFKIYHRSISFLPTLLSNPIALTLSAQIVAIPIVIVHLQEFNCISILSNIIIIPLISILLAGSIAVNCAAFIVGAISPAAQAIDFVFKATLSCVDFLSGLGGHFRVDSPGPVLVIFFFLLSLPIVPWLPRKKVAAVSILSAFAVAWIMLSGSRASERGITVLRHCSDVLVINNAGRKVYLAGTMPRGHHAAVIAEIERLCPDEIDLFIDRPDFHNISGFSRLVKKYPVARCSIAGEFTFSNYMREFFRILDRDRAKLSLHNPAEMGAAGTIGPDQDEMQKTYNFYKRIKSAGKISDNSNNRPVQIIALE